MKRWGEIRKRALLSIFLYCKIKNMENVQYNNVLDSLYIVVYGRTW